MKPVYNGVCPTLIVKDSGLEIGSWFVSLRQINNFDFFFYMYPFCAYYTAVFMVSYVDLHHYSDLIIRNRLPKLQIL